MYPIQCRGGYPMPLVAGKNAVVQIHATVNDVSVDSRLRLIDDSGLAVNAKWGRVLADGTDQDTGICDLRGIANTVGDLRITFADPIKIRNGISVSYATNIAPGSIFVYVK